MTAILTDEQIKAMLNACDLTTPLGQKDYTIILILLHTGIRVSELCSLTLEDFSGDFLYVQGKTNKKRRIQLPPGVHDQIRLHTSHYRTAKEGEDHMFLSQSGDPLTPGDIHKFIAALQERADLGGNTVSAHTFRLTFAYKHFAR
ncbi:tyrosine-type recombinase/integrase [Dictyobacter formicarum]|uniref:Tyr recombinase domain-containing protein n=1 Tax=Dictyobacter formicarum TaxID=2778368 RepID=A0ABQ3VP80_9CHLR|nr:tyrosine-type recombinase/integrase [Dictyobacter formicarum]GHO88049.1 hypothetical protein KSZ_60550 [Dictyobacter formicarum]